MAKIRLLAVDDSVVIRHVISETFASDPAIEVVATASNGRLALAKIEQVQPDIVTLDVEMPEMDGLETLKVIRQRWPKLPVVMFSTLTERGAATTIEALQLGASDYVTKPVNHSGAKENFEALRSQLGPRIRALCKVPEPALDAPVIQRKPAQFAGVQRRIDLPIRIVAIGISTGGPNALNALIPSLPKDFPVPIVIAQHMPAMFTRYLAERLNAMTQLQVREGMGGERLQPGQVWIAPGNYHMTVARRGDSVELATNQDPPENSCRPAVDVLFRSVAATYGPAALAVVMTGMGSDGVRGAAAIRESGGEIAIQDEATSVIWGMPGAVAAAGLADRVWPLDRIGPELAQRVGWGRGHASVVRWHG